MDENKLFYGDNLEVLRKKIDRDTIDLCYIDPPFNSKRTYNQIYNNIGIEDLAQSQAFIDTWTWDEYAMTGYQAILDNDSGRFTKQTIELIKGFCTVLGKGSLLAYLISITLRATEIQRVLKPTGSFFLHCDPTASHYLKVVLDSIFCSQGGDYINEIVWRRSFAHGDGKQGAKHFGRCTDSLLFYTKSDSAKWNPQYAPYSDEALKRDYKYAEEGTKRVYRLAPVDGPGGASKGNPFYEFLGVKGYWRFAQAKMQKLYEDGRIVKSSTGKSLSQKMYLDEAKGRPVDNLWDDINRISPTSSERLGYPTQKPEALLERIIRATTDEGDLVLDCYCGCGTTVCVAQALSRKWIGMDITYQSIALVLKRLEDQFGKEAVNSIKLDGIPRDMASAYALANKKDDRVRKEFEKWAVLTYTKNRAIINQKKGADGGIDGTAYFRTNYSDNAKVILQVKSGNVNRGLIATLRGDMERESAPMGVFITLEPPTAPMVAEAKGAGFYHHDLMDRDYDSIQIVTVQDIIENNKRLDIPMSYDLLKEAKLKASNGQLSLMGDDELA